MEWTHEKGIRFGRGGENRNVVVELPTPFGALQYDGHRSTV